MEESRGKRWLKLLNITEEDLRNNILHKWNGQLTHSDQVNLYNEQNNYLRFRTKLEWTVRAYI